MNWPDLEQNLCPYCGSDLLRSEDGNEWGCISCTFHIEHLRMQKIIAHRKRNPDSADKFLWQNLHDGRCPICNDLLKESDSIAGVLQCTKPTCTFRIDLRQMEEILSDPTHPANRFREQPKENQL